MLIKISGDSSKVIDKKIQAQGFLRRKRLGFHTLRIKAELAVYFLPVDCKFQASIKVIYLNY